MERRKTLGRGDYWSRTVRVGRIGLVVLTMSLAGAVGPAQSQGQAPAGAVQQPALFTPDQLDQLLAPIALHPDPLVGQILMAATYPLEVVQAARWLQDPTHAALTGLALAAALDLQPWDPSVKALVPFPEILRMMEASLDWTEAVGDAFLPTGLPSWMRCSAYASEHSRPAPSSQPPSRPCRGGGSDRRHARGSQASSTFRSMIPRACTGPGCMRLILHTVFLRRSSFPSGVRSWAVSASAWGSRSSRRCGAGTTGTGLITASTSTSTGTVGPAAIIPRPAESGSTTRIIVAGFLIAIRERGRDFRALPRETCVDTALTS